MNIFTYKFCTNFCFRHRSFNVFRLSKIPNLLGSKMSTTPTTPASVDEHSNSSSKMSTTTTSPSPTTDNLQQNGGIEMQAKSSQSSLQNSSSNEPTMEKPNDGGGGNRLAQFRALFDNPNGILGIGKQTIQAYILPRTDAHNSEYICDRDLRVQFLSGFSGSHGYAVITQKNALLWTDGRYYVQAKKELYEGWTMMKWQADYPSPTDWVVQNFEADGPEAKCLTVGFDPKLMEYEKATQMIEKLGNFGIQPVAINTNLVDLIWTERPEEKIQKIIFLSVEECGEEAASKLAKVRGELKKQKCDAIIFSQLDDICWLYNLRGFDIPFNPVFFAYAFVTASGKAYLFIDLRKMTPEVAAHLKKNGIEIFDYRDAGAFLKQYHEACKNAGEHSERHKIWISQSTNYELGAMVSNKNIYLAASPVQKMKVEKNDVELDGMRHGHIRDSAALVKFFYWLKNELELGHLVTESRAARQAKYYREQQEKFVSLSFETISAADEHAALPHYHPDEESGKKLVTKDGIYLLDSGGQYRDATTDVTRTVCFADQPDPHFRQMFTLVLKAHLDLATTKFPAGTSDSQLDGITRAALWRAGYDFGHGTGHGVGHFLNVHEIPPFIGHRLTFNFALQKGAVVTIEPGYYEEGKFGIRIENCYELVQAKGLASGATNYLAFAPLTLVPIQKNLIIREQLEEKHIEWLNRYHNACLESVGRYLQEKGMQEEYNFLAQACTPF